MACCQNKQVLCTGCLFSADEEWTEQNFFFACNRCNYPEYLCGMLVPLREGGDLLCTIKIQGDVIKENNPFSSSSYKYVVF